VTKSLISVNVDREPQKETPWKCNLNPPSSQARADRPRKRTRRRGPGARRRGGYVDELAETRQMLDSRYDDIKSGKVKLIPGDEVEAHFREKSAARRCSPVHDRLRFHPEARKDLDEVWEYIGGTALMRRPHDCRGSFLNSRVDPFPTGAQTRRPHKSSTAVYPRARLSDRLRARRKAALVIASCTAIAVRA